EAPCLERDLLVDQLGRLVSSASPPAVTYIDPSRNDTLSEHPPGNVSVGADWSAGILDTIFSSPIANSSAVFLFYDENGGFWDPVSPPVRTATGDGFRVPLLVLSAFTPRGSIDHQTLDPSALLRFVDDDFGLPYLNSAVRAAPTLSGFFDFGAPARAPLLIRSNFTSTFESTTLVEVTTTPGAAHLAPGLSPIARLPEDRVVRIARTDPWSRGFRWGAL
ncbi:MAG: hypothetical protein L3J96_02860, partial [Thermoplasmata archaeon]|nr:hypothetical protein [Thermoplasmata archaeon]